MKLTFLGTRGYIDASTRRHRRHTALLVEYRRRRVMIDCGEDWIGRVDEIRPHAIMLTHGHPDHALGLTGGVRCPVYATKDTWRVLDHEGIVIEDSHAVKPRSPVDIRGITFEAFTVEHSLNCPPLATGSQRGARPSSTFQTSFTFTKGATRSKACRFTSETAPP